MIELSGLFSHGDRPLEPPPDDDLVRSVEDELGLRLPASYIALARGHNGGYLARSAYPTSRPTTWASDHVAVTSLAAIGRTAKFSLCGELGSHFWVEEWGYPEIGIYFADCPSAGHDMIALDFRTREDEPSVVHVDQEVGYRITYLAPDFATFVNGLLPEEDFDDE